MEINTTSCNCPNGTGKEICNSNNSLPYCVSCDRGYIGYYTLEKLPNVIRNAMKVL